MTSGWILLDKPTTVFSRTAGGRVARMFGTKKFGHIGTLDPMATGVLPIAIGDATKMIPFVEDAHDAVKEYDFACTFGAETDTLDATGREIARTGIVPAKDDVLRATGQLLGDCDQIPPIYSAVHVNGTRAYELARAGRAVDVAPRRVHIYSLELTHIDGDEWHFHTRVSRGTYVRSIARDVAKLCGTLATVTMIRRTYTNGVDVKNTVQLDFLENLFNNGGNIKNFLMPVDFGLGDIPVLNLDDNAAAFYRNGGFVTGAWADGLHRVYNGDTFIGIGAVYDGELRPKRTI